MNLFKDLYQQVVIFKKERREITFVTKQLLGMFLHVHTSASFSDIHFHSLPRSPTDD